MMNYSMIIQSIALHVPLVMGVYILFYILDVADLSIEAAYLMGAVVSAQLLNYCSASALPIPLIMIASLCAGAAVGLGTVLIARACKVPHILASIIMIGIIQASAYALASGAHATIAHHQANLSGIIILSISFGIGLMYFFRTQLGYAMIIYGKNKKFLHHHHISEFFVYTSGIVLSNALAGLSGFMVVFSYDFFDISMAQGVLLLSLCAAMIGFIIVKQCTPIAHSAPLIGTTAYFIIQNLLVKAGCTSAYFTLIQSLLLIICFVSLRFLTNAGRHG